jgi:hypothetical protein
VLEGVELLALVAVEEGVEVQDVEEAVCFFLEVALD